MPNPFTISFDLNYKTYIDRASEKKSIKDSLDSNSSRAIIITGAKGSGKTILYNQIIGEYSLREDYLVINMPNELNILEELASSIYDSNRLSINYIYGYRGKMVKIIGKKILANIRDVLDYMFKDLSSQNIKLLIGINDVISTSNIKTFFRSYQLFTNKGYKINVLLKGEFELMHTFESNKDTSTLYKILKVNLGPLNISSIEDAYKKELDMDRIKAKQCANLTQGYPIAYQALGYFIYENDMVYNDKVLEQYKNFLEDEIYNKIWISLSEIEKKIILSFDSYEEVKVKDIISTSGLSNSYFSMYRDRLMKKGIIECSSYGKIRVVLPKFIEFARKDSYRFENELSALRNKKYVEDFDISKASIDNLDIIKDICDKTIMAIYPKYYPKGAVDFFINHHSIENIKKDILDGLVYIIKTDDEIIGTVTIVDNHINRLFVYPEFHKKGFGKALFVFGEIEIFKNFDKIILDASLPSKSMYLKNGYKDITYNKILTDNGDYLCYDMMEKKKD